MGRDDKDPTGWPDSTPDRLDPAGPVLADAIVALVQARPDQLVGDASAAMQALVDLIAEAQASIPHAVIAARHQHYSWDHIAGILGISPATAIRRHGRTSRNENALMNRTDGTPEMVAWGLQSIRGSRPSPAQRASYQPKRPWEGR